MLPASEYALGFYCVAHLYNNNTADQFRADYTTGNFQA